MDNLKFRNGMLGESIFFGNVELFVEASPDKTIYILSNEQPIKANKELLKQILYQVKRFKYPLHIYESIWIHAILIS